MGSGPVPVGVENHGEIQLYSITGANAWWDEIVASTAARMAGGVKFKAVGRELKKHVGALTVAVLKQPMNILYAMMHI